MIVFICSPYRGDAGGNERRALDICRRWSLSGHVPIAPHLYFTRFLDDGRAAEREMGLLGALELIAPCDEVHVYPGPRGRVSEGMAREIEHAERLGKPVVYHDGE